MRYKTEKRSAALAMAGEFRIATEKYLEHLQKNNYSPGTIEQVKKKIAIMTRYLTDNCITEYTEEIGWQFYELYSSVRRFKSRDYTQGWIRFIRKIADYLPDHCRKANEKTEELSAEIIENLKEYEKYCKQSGNREITAEMKRKAIEPFLLFCQNRGVSIQKIDAQIVSEYSKTITYSGKYSALRSYLKYLHECEFISYDYSPIVPKRSHIFKLPDHYTIDELNRIEKSVNRSTSIGKRNFAMMLLLTRYGMRRGDIASLKFENIDYDRKIISFVQDKTGSPHRLPLYDDVLEAIDDYVRNGRPLAASCDYIFIRSMAPYTRMAGGTIYYTLNKYMILAEIKTDGKKHGPHSIRSSVATSMINDSVPYAAVQNMLGHKSEDTIRHYAKIDIERLRCCALESPKPSKEFMLFLNQGK